MIIVRRMMCRVDLWVLADDATVSMNFSDQLPIQIKQAEEQKSSTGNSRKPVSDSFVQREPEQGQKQTQHRGKNDVPTPGEGSNCKRFRMIPSLRARCQYKWEPMRRDRRVKKCNGESGDRDGRENSFVHISKKCGRA